MIKFKKSALALAAVGGLALSLITSSPALANSNSKPCTPATASVHGFSAYSEVSTYSSFAACGQMQVSATYGTKCGLRSAWTYGTGIVTQAQTKTCTGWHKAATSVTFNTYV
ncbi:hypothetical protein FB468_1722 [Leucobacter komagatae]|uniref:Uncharacterized protein n=1 Tax=Leucobacter komagatae TaxID=55969 RepID=A0A542Y6H0_9MICO|nr:hypothetical protein FB468_1722 [Leucobacter komagatae]